MQKEKEIKKKLQSDINQKIRENSRHIEEIEKLKFKQDVKTGLTYFDKVREISKESKQEIELLK